MYKSIVCGLLLSSSVFAGSFDFSYMMERQGYTKKKDYYIRYFSSDFKNVIYVDRCNSPKRGWFVCDYIKVSCKSGMFKIVSDRVWDSWTGEYRGTNQYKDLEHIYTISPTWPLRYMCDSINQVDGL